MNQAQFMEFLRTNEANWMLKAGMLIRCLHDGIFHCPLSFVAETKFGEKKFDVSNPAAAGAALGITRYLTGRIKHASDIPNDTSLRQELLRACKL